MNSTTRKPLTIALLSFDRPEYLHQVLQSLASQLQSDDQVFLFQDGGWSPKRASWKAKQETADLCSRLFRAYFPHSSVFSSSDNLGIAGNYRRAEDYLFSALHSDAAVFLEDDLVLGSTYLDVIGQLLSFAEADDRIGYVSAYGDLWATIDEQRTARGVLKPMHENWGAAMTRTSWLKQKPIRDAYSKLIENVDYGNRDSAAIVARLRRHADHKPGCFSLDRMRRERLGSDHDKYLSRTLYWTNWRTFLPRLL